MWNPFKAPAEAERGSGVGVEKPANLMNLSPERLVELVSDYPELAGAVYEYDNHIRAIERGGRSLNDNQLLADAEVKVVELLADRGWQLEFKASPYNAEIDDAVPEFVKLYKENYGHHLAEDQAA